MSNAFKVLGFLILAFGILDMGLLMYNISIHRILGIDVPRFIGPRSYLFEIGYGALTMFVANYLKRPVQKKVDVVDLSDPFICADAHFIPVEPPAPAFKIELRDVAFAFLWGSVVVLLFMVVFVRFVPGLDAMLFDAASLAPKTHKLLVIGSVFMVLLPLLYGIFGMKLRQPLYVVAMMSGAAISALMLCVTTLSNQSFATAIYGPAFMVKAYTALGHADGLPENWSIEREIIARLEAASRAQRYATRRYFK